MAISWGSEVKNSSGNGMRVGYEFSQSPATVGAGTSSVTVTVRVYVWTRRSVYDSSNTLSISGSFGSWSGSVNISHGNNGGTTLARTMTRTVTPSYTGTVSSSVSVSLTGIAPISGTARASGSWSTGRRPISAPAAPTNTSVERGSDTAHTVRWSNTSPGSVSNPYQKVQVQRWDIASGSYKTIATLNGSPTSYTDKTTAGNQQYRYRVRAYNTGGYSGFASTPYIATTPAAPASVRATKNTSGDIVVSWSLAGVRKSDGIEVWLTEGGVDLPGASAVTLSGRPTSWTHAGPDAAKTWSYRVKAIEAATGNETGPKLWSGFSARSNTVQLLTNPLAPTGLAPASVVRDATDPITLSWRHNEVDGTEQTAYQISHRAQGTTAWTSTGKVASGTSSHLLGGGTYDNGETIEWRVQTWGLYASPSPYSNSALITLSTPPSATIVIPEDGQTWASAATGVAWTFYDPEGDPQSQWRATLLSGAGDQLETRSGSGAGTSLFAFNTRLEDGQSYSISVELRDSTGLWSPPDQITINVAYPRPPAPNLTGGWDHETGTATITVENPAWGEGQDGAEYSELWQSTNGSDWVQIMDQLPPNTTVTDYIPALGGINYYRATAVTELGARQDSEPLMVDTTDHRWWVWVNAGPGFMQAVRVRDNATLQVGSGRAKALHQFAGRRQPVEYVGDQRRRDISLSARFAPESSAPQEVEALADMPAPACIRTPDGQRYFVSLGDPSISYQGMTKELSWSFTEIDHSEGGPTQ